MSGEGRIELETGQVNNECKLETGRVKDECKLEQVGWM